MRVVVIVCLYYKQMHQFTRKTLFGFKLEQLNGSSASRWKKLNSSTVSKELFFSGCWKSIKTNDFFAAKPLFRPRSRSWRGEAGTGAELVPSHQAQTCVGHS